MARELTDEEALELEVNDLLATMNEKSKEVEDKFNQIVKQIEQPITVYRYKAIGPVYMDDVQDAVSAAMNVLADRKIIDLSDHGSRDIHDSLAMMLSDYFGDPNYKNHVKQEKTDGQTNS